MSDPDNYVDRYSALVQEIESKVEVLCRRKMPILSGIGGGPIGRDEHAEQWFMRLANAQSQVNIMLLDKIDELERQSTS